MRFRMIVEASKDSEAGVMLDGAALQPSSKSARIVYSGGKKTGVDGPFAETKELIAGYWLIQVKSRAEAIEWAQRAPNPHGEGGETDIELRQLFELEDFEPSPAIDRHRAVDQQLQRRKK